jgi:YVTN family beta-propeller protein
MKVVKLLLSLAIIAAVVTGCEKNGDPQQTNDYSKGIYVVNEGAFGSSTGSISYYDPVEGTIINGIFESANNNGSTGDVVQSFAVVCDTLGYIVVNASNKVKIVDLKTFKIMAEPIEVFYPRYFIQISSDKGYLSAGKVQGNLHIIDLNTHSIIDSIEVGHSPENMVKFNDLVYVINSGTWSLDSTISVVNSAIDEVVDTINVGKMPCDIALDGNDNIWVYCMGYYDWVSVETEAQLMKIDPGSGTVVWKANIGMAGDYNGVPPKMASSKDGSKIYYLRPDGVYRISTADPVPEEESLIQGNFYGIDVNPSDGNIYVFEVTTYTGNGKMKIFNEDGIAYTEGEVGIGPNGAVFNLD